jgi:hypothetical protein
MSIVRSGLLTLVVFASFAAQALPTQTLFVQAVRLAENSQGPLMFVGYTEFEADESKRYGSQIQPMEEGVADTLSKIPENKMMECDARYFQNGRFVYVYSLTNCK